VDFVPQTEKEVQQMLEEIGVESFNDLLKEILPDLKCSLLNLPDGISEPELLNRMRRLASRNVSVSQRNSFLGAGAYDHFIPEVVRDLSSRAEFSTAYTPYQPEASQGFLQAMFEYQTAICELTAMDVSNASLYDGASAMAEAVLMALRTKGEREKVLASRAVHPEYRAVLGTYLRGSRVRLEELPCEDGATALSELDKRVDEQTAAVVVQSPNFFGCLEDMQGACEIAHGKGSLFIAVVNPLSLGILLPPGEYGADIAVGDGQPLGNDLYFGGPYLGFMACTGPLMRKMPGRIIGTTEDVEGKRGFVLTLQTREQHIRREKATSNICTNHALNALRACIYLCCLGKEGIGRVAETNLQKSHYLSDLLTEIEGLTIAFSSPFFNEFTIRCPVAPSELNERLAARGILGGIELGRWYPTLGDCLLISVTETKTKEQLDDFVTAVREVL
jgi:glycine dehydrogenase subunit 1